MVVGSAEPIIAGALAFLCLLASVAVIGGVVLWRRLRRRWHRLRTHAVVRGAGALLDVASTARFVGRRGANGTISVDAGALSVGQARWQMWRSVGAAERSVSEAQALGAPTADLPALTRRLHSAANDVDHLLTIGRGLHPRSDAAADVRRQLAEVIAAADHINAAAAAAASGTMAPQVRRLAADAEHELTALASAMGRTHSLDWH